MEPRRMVWNRTVIIILLTCAAIAVMMSGCDTSKKPPDLILEYGGMEYTATLGTYSWSYPGGAINADAEGPLGWQDLITTIIKEPEEDTLCFHFNKAPDSYEIRWWNDEHWNDYEAYQENNGIIVKDNSIPLTDEDGMIYEVHATWKEKGDAYYGFYVKPTTPDILNADVKVSSSQEQNDLVYHDYGSGIELEDGSTIIYDKPDIDGRVDIDFINIINVKNNEIIQQIYEPLEEKLAYPIDEKGVYQVIAVTDNGDCIDLTPKVLIETKYVVENEGGFLPLN